jgi:SAM-dependent methyltransferase
MKTTKCLLCGGETLGQEARIAPFLVERCGLKEATTTARYCMDCDFFFFERRLSQLEADSLYQGYRGDAYNEVRIRHEPHYRDAIATLGDKSSQHYLDRFRDIALAFEQFPELSFRRILDFGGDGEIPKILFPAAAVAVDDLNAGSRTDKARYDLIFASNVFEHVSDPVHHLMQLASRLASNGVIWIDVPVDYDGSISISLFKHRVGGDANPIWMHEHINAFSRKSLRILAKRCGLAQIFEANPIVGLFAAMDSEVATQFLPHLHSRSGSHQLRRMELSNVRALEVLSKGLADKDLALAECRATLAAVLASKSWRITAPLRALIAGGKSMLARARGRPSR